MLPMIPFLKKLLGKNFYASELEKAYYLALELAETPDQIKKKASKILERAYKIPWFRYSRSRKTRCTHLPKTKQSLYFEYGYVRNW